MFSESERAAQHSVSRGKLRHWSRKIRQSAGLPPTSRTRRRVSSTAPPR